MSIYYAIAECGHALRLWKGSDSLCSCGSLPARVSAPMENYDFPHGHGVQLLLSSLLLGYDQPSAHGNVFVPDPQMWPTPWKEFRQSIDIKDVND